MAKERILVVDDSAEIRQVIAETILLTAGYDVLTARDGEEGLTLARDLQPDLIIADYLMPKMNGINLVIALKEQGLDIPTILITAEGSEQLAVEAMRAGIRDYIIKPIISEVLLESVRLVLKRHWASQIKERMQAQLFDANRILESRIRELGMLMSIGTSVTALRDLQQILNQVTEAAANATSSEEASLMLIDRSTGELYIRASKNFDEKTTQTLRLKVQDSLAGQVVKTSQPLIINSGSAERIKIKTQYLVKSILMVPLRVRGRVIGTLGVDNRTRERDYDSQDAQVLSILADFASVAIENAELYAQVLQERNTLDAILRDTDDHVIVVNAEERVLFCNPTAVRTFQITTKDFIGKPVREVVSNPEVLSLFSREAYSGRGTRSEITIGVGDSEKVLNAQLTVLEGIGRAVVMQDITHLKQIDKAKSDFVSTVAHDLRSPLTAILGYTELLQRAGELNEQQDKFAEQIISSVHSITLLITELLELSRIEAGYSKDLQPVNLEVIARKALEGLNPQITAKGHALKVEVPAELPHIMGNQVRLQQLLANLLGNAVKYTPDNGKVRLSAWVDGDTLVLQVADNGIGIPAEDQPYVFDKFYRTDRAINEFEGTGLGLAIVKGIVEQHGGRIWLDSKENEGTTFTVVLPIPSNGTSHGPNTH